MRAFYTRSFLFWFVLLVVALINATLREMTYKPLLTPYIGAWAHQISSVTGILLFYAAIFIFLKRLKTSYTRRDLFIVGSMWIAMTIIFECWMNIAIRKLTIMEVVQTYYFWKGETWIFVLLSLITSPFIAHNTLGRK